MGIRGEDGWLEDRGLQHTRRAALCWVFWICAFGLVTGVVLVVLWMRAKAPQGQDGG